MRREYVQSLLGLALLIGFSLAFGHVGDGVSRGAKGEVRLAYFPNLTHAPILVAVKDGIYEKRLPGYGIKSFVVNAGPEAMEALLAGDVDIACVGPSPALNTYAKSGGKALRIVAGVCSGGASLMARDGVAINSVTDLAGKTVADPEFGGTQDVSLRHFLKLNGLASRESGGNVEVMALKNPDILTAFKRGQLDAAWVPEPWASRLAAEAHARRVVDERTLWPGGRITTAVLVARTGFLNAHPDVVEAVVEGTQAAMDRLAKNPAAGEAEANEEIKHLTGKPLKQAVIADAWSRMEFSTTLDQNSLAAFAGAARDAGYLTDRAIDLGLVCYDPGSKVQKIAAR
jgi:NitT/TauT family transport system substrate-binding protein